MGRSWCRWSPCSSWYIAIFAGKVSTFVLSCGEHPMIVEGEIPIWRYFCEWRIFCHGNHISKNKSLNFRWWIPISSTTFLAGDVPIFMTVCSRNSHVHHVFLAQNHSKPTCSSFLAGKTKKTRHFSSFSPMKSTFFTPFQRRSAGPFVVSCGGPQYLGRFGLRILQRRSPAARGFLQVRVEWDLDGRYIYIYVGIVTPTDFHIFQRGRYTTNQICYSLPGWWFGTWMDCFSIKSWVGWNHQPDILFTAYDAGVSKNGVMTYCDNQKDAGQ